MNPPEHEPAIDWPADRKELAARALYLGERIDPRRVPGARLASHPVVVRVGADGFAVLFRFGAVVLFNVPEVDELGFMRELTDRVGEPPVPIETEDAEIEIDTSARERVVEGVIRLNGVDAMRLQLVADVLAKSVAFARYETRLEEVFAKIEPLAIDLARSGRSKRPSKELVRDIGAILLAQQEMVWRVEGTDKPELLWDHPELERLYASLEDEYELKERNLAMEHKITLLSRTASTVLELLYNRRALRVEWYIVLLIVVEIGLMLYEMSVR